MGDKVLHAIAIPGHTAGSTAFHMVVGGRNVLLSGDTVLFDNRLGTQHVVTVEGIGWRFVDEPVPGRGALAPRRA